jgi:hypothetical protein
MDPGMILLANLRGISHEREKNGASFMLLNRRTLMCLQIEIAISVPQETQRIAQASFPKGNVYTHGSPIMGREREKANKEAGKSRKRRI